MFFFFSFWFMNRNNDTTQWSNKKKKQTNEIYEFENFNYFFKEAIIIFMAQVISEKTIISITTKMATIDTSFPFIKKTYQQIL